MTRAIVTYAEGPHVDLLAIAEPGIQSFATRHGYDRIHGVRMCDRPAPWNKIPVLLDVLRTYDEALWLDADTIIVDGSKDLPFPKGNGFIHAMVRHFGMLSEVPNTGVWYLTRAMIPLLQAAWKLDVFWDHGWWEQAAVMSVMGYSVPPQGSIFDRTQCRCVRRTEWVNRCLFLPTAWNSHPNYRSERPRIVHCSYPSQAMRVEVMTRLASDAGYEYPERPRR